MFGKKALRLATAALLAGATLGAAAVGGAAAHPAQAASGTVTLTDWQFPDGCNAIATASVVQQEVCGGTMEDTMFVLDNKLNYDPDIALNVPTTKNGEVKIVGGNLQVTYKIKPNLKWSDGTPLTVDDFVFSVAVDIAAGDSAGIDQIAKMQKVNSTTLVVTYKGIYAPFVAYGNPQPFLPQHYLTTKYHTTDPAKVAAAFLNDNYNSPSDVFCGSYKIGTWTAGSEIDLVPNPYGGPLGKAQLSTFKFKSYTSEEATLAADLLSPQTDADQAEDFQFTDLPVLQRSKYQITELPALEVEHLELNQLNPALRDVRVRQALQYALDKSTIFKDAFPALASQANTYLLRTILPNASPFDNKSEPLPAYDPNKARALLKAAGYSYVDASGHTVTGPKGKLYLNFYTTTTTTRQQVEGLIAQYWAKIGVTTNPHFVSPYGNGGLFSDYDLNGVLLRRHYDVALFAFSEAPDPQQSEFNYLPQYIPTQSLHSGAEENYNGIDDPAYATAADKLQAKLLVEARTIVNPTERKSVLNQWQHVVDQQVYWIMMYARQDIAAHKPTFGPYLPNSSQATNEWNAYAWHTQ